MFCFSIARCGACHGTFPSSDRLVESLDAFDAPTLHAYVDQLKHLSEHLAFFARQGMAQGLRRFSLDRLFEAQYVRNHFDLCDDFAPDGCTLAQPDGRSEIHFGRDGLEAQLYRAKQSLIPRTARKAPDSETRGALCR